MLLDLYILMGGVDIKLPDGVTVTCDLTSLMGGVEYFGESVGVLAGQRTMTRGKGPRVLVKARTIMGGAKLYQPR